MSCKGHKITALSSLPHWEKETESEKPDIGWNETRNQLSVAFPFLWKFLPELSPSE